MEQSVRPPGQGTGPGFDIEDVVARRVLAWAGALAIVVGIAFLVAIAVDRGLIGPGGRVALAGAGSALLFAAGAWLYERKGRTQAALAAVGTGVSGFYLTLVGATQLYHLVPVPLAL